MKISVFVCFILLTFKLSYGNKDSILIHTDTSFVFTQIPSNEKELFNGLDYNIDKKASGVNPFTAMIEYILRKLFDRADPEFIRIIRSITTWLIVIICLIIVYRILKKYGWGIPMHSEQESKGISAFSDIQRPLSEYKFDEWIEKFIKENNYRMAFRWIFLKILYQLEQKKIISFSPQKTILDFKNMMKNHPQHHEFDEIAGMFEYVWYGKFNLHEKLFFGLKEKCSEFERKLRT